MLERSLPEENGARSKKVKGALSFPQTFMAEQRHTAVPERSNAHTVGGIEAGCLHVSLHEAPQDSPAPITHPPSAETQHNTIFPVAKNRPMRGDTLG